jgi:hypothetical protein
MLALFSDNILPLLIFHGFWLRMAEQFEVRLNPRFYNLITESAA